MMLENHLNLNLELILEDPDTGFLVQQEIQIETVRRFLHDINEWATVIKTSLLLHQSTEGILDGSENL